jgi:hypothetical protein
MVFEERVTETPKPVVPSLLETDSGELWNSVQVRIERVKQVYGEIGKKGGIQGLSQLALRVLGVTEMQ